MRYISDIGNGQQLHIENEGNQTFIGVSSRGPGQQQSQSNAFDTGKWANQPLLYKIDDVLIVQIEGEKGTRFLRLSGNQSQSTDRPADLENAQKLPLTESSEPGMKRMEPMKPMKPMEPMKPMKPMDPLS